MCFFVVVVGVVVGFVDGVLLVDELLLPPQAANTKVMASAARSVSMAVSGNLRIGRAPIVTRGLGRPPYQALPAPPPAHSEAMSVETAATPRAPELPSDGAARSSSSQWLLVVCCVAQFMVILDLSIVNVALPHIQSDLGFSNPGLQWVVDAYAITFAGFLILGGRAADHFGQRRTFVLALLLFGVASLFGGVAPSQGVLIGARALQGFAGALMAASSLAIITASFAPGPPLHRAIGIWAAMNGLGGAAGVLLGGIITEFLSWRWVLLINPPIAIAAAFVAWTVVTERRGTRGEVPFDIAGALTLTLGQMVLVFGVVEAGLKGWSSFAAIGPIVLGVLLLVGFGVIESRIAKAPLIPFKELTQTLKNANTIVLLFSSALFPMWILSTLYLQQVLGLTALDTGLLFLPMTLTIMVVARSAGRLVSALGVREVLGSGLIMMTVGLLLLTRIAPSGSGIVYVMIPGILVAAGIALSIVPSTIAATQGSKPGQAGLASGLVNTSRQVGGGLGLAVLITLATQRTSNLIGAGEQVDQALTHGFRLAYLIGAVLCGLAALMTFLTMPRGEAARRPARLMALAVGGVLALFLGLTAAFAGNKGPPLGQYSMDGAYTFVSAPSLHPPEIKIGAHAPASQLAPGYIFATNFLDLNEPPIVGQSGPLILDRQLQPVWFQPVPEQVVAADLSLQSLHGKPVLAWWQGKVTSTGATES
ncbi:MAG TPA: MFS transporter, partial [Solirubrobacteraceae bacterium]|nr:MFS transporter [Solirubrobacteraceae bacterium]